jgi:hypothetical protein
MSKFGKVFYCAMPCFCAVVFLWMASRAFERGSLPEVAQWSLASLGAAIVAVVFIREQYKKGPKDSE